MQLHQLAKTHKNKKKKRVGRGGKRGTYSGKGIKGQKARAGRKMRPELRDIIKKLPKQRGYRFASIRVAAVPINLEKLEKFFKDGDVVSPKTIYAKDIIRKAFKGVPIKVLGKGALTKKLTIEGCAVSASARAAVEQAGGIVKDNPKTSP